MDGPEFPERLKDRLGEPGVATVMISGGGNESVAVRAAKSGADDYISKKDLKPALLFKTVENAIARFQLDLAKRKSVEALAESEKLYHGLADAMPQIVWTARPDGHRDYFNGRWYEFAGSGKDDNWTLTLHPDDVRPGQESWNASLISGEPYEIQSRLRERKSGNYCWHLVRALAQRDAEGMIVKWVAAPPTWTITCDCAKSWSGASRKGRRISTDRSSTRPRFSRRFTTV
jgi:PAS domain-containing protein